MSVKANDAPPAPATPEQVAKAEALAFKHCVTMTVGGARRLVLPGHVVPVSQLDAAAIAEVTSKGWAVPASI